MTRRGTRRRIPVVVLTGHLGAGKTTLLNHLLRQPGARVGVVVNDFGDINVDAGLVSGQIDEPASIAGGCLCCLPDAGGLDEALEKLTHPRLALDAVVVEASGLAEPSTLARMIRFSGVEQVRPGGLIEVVDAIEYFATIDDDRGAPPARFAEATLVVINKVDRLSAEHEAETLARIERRIRERNPVVPIVHAVRCRLDPALVYDAAATEDPPDQLPIGALLRDAGDDTDTSSSPEHARHHHAASISVGVPGAIEPSRLMELLGDPPSSAYRIKGTVWVGGPRRTREYVVNVVGRSAHVAAAASRVPDPSRPPSSELVAIGLDLDTEAVRERLRRALEPAARPSQAGLRRLRQYVRLGL